MVDVKPEVIDAYKEGKNDFYEGPASRDYIDDFHKFILQNALEYFLVCLKVFAGHVGALVWGEVEQCLVDHICD